MMPSAKRLNQSFATSALQLITKICLDKWKNGKENRSKLPKFAINGFTTRLPQLI